MTSDRQAALRECEASIWADLQALSMLVSEEKRSFTASEQHKFDYLHSELDRVNRQRKEAERVSRLSAGLTAPSGQYVNGPVPACRTGGCQATELGRMLAETSGRAREVMDILRRKEETMTPMEPTRSLWCEQGDHSFSEKDPDMQVIAMQRKGPDGEKVTESRTTCGKCAAIVMNRIGQAQNTTVSAELRGGE